MGGGASKASARVCSSFNTAAIDTDAALLEVYLPLYSNYKCGKPGNYLFDVSPTSCMYALKCNDIYISFKPSWTEVTSEFGSPLLRHITQHFTKHALMK